MPTWTPRNQRGVRAGIAWATIVAGFAIAAFAGAQDTVRVKADGRPAWGESVRLVEEFSVGQVDGPTEYAFGRLDRIAVAPGGAFYTYDANDTQIRRYDAKGKYANAIGRKGGGPGEYQSVAAMAVTRD